MSDKKKMNKAIVKVCKRLWARNMLASADGNVSYRLSDQEILITPSGVAKAFMDPDEMAVIDIEGNILKGEPSSERLMHLAVYRKAPQAKAVVHAHPPHAIAWSVSRPDLTELPSECLSEVILACGSIPLVPYATPSTEEMGQHLENFLPDYRVMILSRHGGLAWGESLEEAVNGMERLEHSAEILWLAQTMGELTSLPPSSVERLKTMRKEMGPRIL
ncbi:MAG: class II aldolase/adducin family protein [Bdellovibrionales bacterium]|nr:class II aldolase/adducin family protein [Bdellovibrionales bacterium]